MNFALSNGKYGFYKLNRLYLTQFKRFSSRTLR
jgi:hypothetical protein